MNQIQYLMLAACAAVVATSRKFRKNNFEDDRLLQSSFPEVFPSAEALTVSGGFNLFLYSQ